MRSCDFRREDQAPLGTDYTQEAPICDSLRGAREMPLNRRPRQGAGVVMMIVVIISQVALQGFIHPGLDLKTGEIIELEAEPAPIQLELFEPLDGEGTRA